LYEEASSTLRWANTKEEKEDWKKLNTLLRDSLEECVMQASLLNPDKVP
jgi:hypothetical protein